mmetsp:Transcript_76725/g.193019  ORF Transcript_76725/g.193019 Transcript_76725/m.193019 type:complete len:230 (-) Transcript_76725:1073-1762(-)
MLQVAHAFRDASARAGAAVGDGVRVRNCGSGGVEQAITTGWDEQGVKEHDAATLGGLLRCQGESENGELRAVHTSCRRVPPACGLELAARQRAAGNPTPVCHLHLHLGSDPLAGCLAHESQGESSHLHEGSLWLGVRTRQVLRVLQGWLRNAKVQRLTVRAVCSPRDPDSRAFAEPYLPLKGEGKERKGGAHLQTTTHFRLHLEDHFHVASTHARNQVRVHQTRVGLPC